MSGDSSHPPGNPRRLVLTFRTLHQLSASKSTSHRDAILAGLPGRLPSRATGLPLGRATEAHPGRPTGSSPLQGYRFTTQQGHRVACTAGLPDHHPGRPPDATNRCYIQSCVRFSLGTLFHKITLKRNLSCSTAMHQKLVI